MPYIKTDSSISLESFIQKCKSIKEFTSSSGKRYIISSVDNSVMRFFRLDGKRPDLEWSINLKILHEAYVQLDDFLTINFKPFLPRVHSPARGLLIHLGLLK